MNDKRPTQCPECHEPLKRGATLCASCGYDYEMGYKIDVHQGDAEIAPRREGGSILLWAVALAGILGLMAAMAWFVIAGREATLLGISLLTLIFLNVACAAAVAFTLLRHGYAGTAAGGFLSIVVGSALAVVCATLLPILVVLRIQWGAALTCQVLMLLFTVVAVGGVIALQIRGWSESLGMVMPVWAVVLLLSFLAFVAVMAWGEGGAF